MAILRRIDCLFVVLIFILVSIILYVNLNIEDQKSESMKHQRRHFKDVFLEKRKSKEIPEDFRRAWLDTADDHIKQAKGRKRKRARKFRKHHESFEEKIESSNKNHKGDIDDMETMRKRRKKHMNLARKSEENHNLTVNKSSGKKLPSKIRHPRLFTGKGKAQKEKGHEFMRKMTRGDTILAMETIKKFQTLMKNRKIVYFLSLSGLLGSYRHHGFVPWSENVDFMLPSKYRKTVAKILEEAEPEYTLDDTSDPWKFYKWSAKSFGKTWKWPYVGVGFYESNVTHVWNLDPHISQHQDIQYNKIDIFPLKKRPFLGMILPAPNRSNKLVTKTFDIAKCTAASYDYKRGKKLSEQHTVDCDTLKSTFPFVERKSVGKQEVNETLVMNGQVIAWFIDKE